MKTSARNEFVGTVSKHEVGAVNDEIEITLGGGLKIVAIVTRESAKRLELAVGARAFALVKASSIVLATDVGNARLSTRNQTAGVVTGVLPGRVNAEVVIDVGGGALTIAAIVTLASVKVLGLAPGAAATALFKASSVIVGVPG